MSKVRAKTNMKPFEQINDPIVITMPVYEKMALFGNESMGTYQKRAGDMFVVYDWENNEIHDWCLFESHEWRACPISWAIVKADCKSSV